MPALHAAVTLSLLGVVTLSLCRHCRCNPTCQHCRMLRTCTSCNEHVGTSTESARRPQDNAEQQKRKFDARRQKARASCIMMMILVNEVVHVGYAFPPLHYVHPRFLKAVKPVKARLRPLRFSNSGERPTGAP